MSRRKKPREPNKKPVLVTLYQAFGWDCPSCKAKNHNDGIFVEMTRAEQIAMAEHYDSDPDLFKTGEIIAAPEEVTCSTCQKSFKVRPPEEE